MNEAAAPGWRRWAARLVATKGFWRVTILIIIANAIVIGMGTFNLDPRAMRTGEGGGGQGAGLAALDRDG